jgi:hypothetical protein
MKRFDMTDTCTAGKLDDDWEVVVCSSCLTAACWHGVFYCDGYRTANVKSMKIGDLRKLGPLESEDYWRRDEGIKRKLGTARPAVERRT